MVRGPAPRPIKSEEIGPYRDCFTLREPATITPGAAENKKQIVLFRIPVTVSPGIAGELARLSLSLFLAVASLVPRVLQRTDVTGRRRSRRHKEEERASGRAASATENARARRGKEERTCVPGSRYRTVAENILLCGFSASLKLNIDFASRAFYARLRLPLFLGASLLFFRRPNMDDFANGDDKDPVRSADR